MRRTQIYIDDDQDERLAQRASAGGVTKSALIREAIDVYLNGSRNPAEELAQFRAAVRDAAGVARRLPPGREYVERLRRNDARRLAELERRRRS